MPFELIQFWRNVLRNIMWSNQVKRKKDIHLLIIIIKKNYVIVLSVTGCRGRSLKEADSQINRVFNKFTFEK